MKNLVLAIFSLALLAVSCNDEITTDLNAPVITITSPVQSNGGEYFVDSNNVIQINAEVTDNDELHTIDLVITNSYNHGNGETVEMLRESTHSHGTSFLIDRTYTIDTACHSNYYIKVIASDHNDNVSRDSVKIHVHGYKGVMPMCN